MNTPNANADSLVAELDELLRRVDALPTLDTRSADEILGYDENGIPTKAS
jgi:antitoxin VapB